MHRLLASRVVQVVVALFTLSAYGERAFARFLTCECPCCPAEVLVLTVDDGKIATPEAGNTGLAQISAGENGKAADGHHDEDGKGCSCPCHAATFANVPAVAPALASRRLCAATLHPGVLQRPCEGVRAGIEYPPRAA